VRDPSVIGVERVIIGPEEGSFWTAPAARVLFSQPLVFNRTSRLTEDMVVDRMVGPLFRRKSITVPAGARMFVTATPDGLDAHCLLPRNPLVMRAFAALDMSDQLPCYIDTDFDGRLDSQRNGTEATTTGIHSLRFDFSPIGAVLSPARFEETPPESGAAGYRFGVEAVENNLSPGLQEIVLGMWAAASDSWPRGTARGRARVLIREGETATAEIAGAKIEFRYTGDRTIAFKILECLPERPIVMRAS
jgi:hypothetical protein